MARVELYTRPLKMCKADEWKTLTLARMERSTIRKITLGITIN